MKAIPFYSYPTATRRKGRWPPYNNSCSSEALLAFKGSKVVYIGEYRGLSTGDNNFHHLLAEYWKLIEKIEIPNWTSIHDSVYLYKRK